MLSTLLPAAPAVSGADHDFIHALGSDGEFHDDNQSEKLFYTKKNIGTAIGMTYIFNFKIPTRNLTQPMKTIHPLFRPIAALALGLNPSVGFAQSVSTFDNGNNLQQQASNGPSVRGVTFNFLGGNDRLILLRNDDFAGLGTGIANMGDGRDVVATSFNMSGGFDLGSGNDLFVCEGDVSFNDSVTDIVVLGGTGNDIIAVTTEHCDYRGEVGNDVFVSDGSNNSFDGGDGTDTYSAEFAEFSASINLVAGTAFARFNLTSDTLIGIENARGSDFADTILGNSGPNRIDGLGGGDAIDGGPGNDTISGGGGTNTLFGNSGIDTLVVDGTITSKTRNGTTMRVIGSLNGVPFDNTAKDFEQVLDNGVLKSVIFFIADPNFVDAVVPQPNLVIAETAVLPAITALLAGQTLTGNGNANTINGGTGSDDIAGLDGNDTLNGKAGDDFINGGNGNDKLDGGSGSDRLTGGSGTDTFIFTAAGKADIISDYNVADDTISIKASLVGNLPVGNLAANRFKKIPQGSVDGDDRIIYDSSTGELSFDSNGSATGGRVLIATLPIGLSMVAGEIKIQ